MTKNLLSDPIALALLEAYSDGGGYDYPEGYVIVEDGNWTQDHKYQHRTDVAQHIPTDRYFQIEQSRSGSYHSDWYNNEPTIYEVKPHTELVPKTTWKYL